MSSNYFYLGQRMGGTTAYEKTNIQSNTHSK